MQTQRFGLAFLLLVTLSACSESKDAGPPPSPDAGDVAPDAGEGPTQPLPAPPEPYAQLRFDIESVEVADPTLAAGFQGRLLRGDDGTLYYAYLKFTGRDGECDIAVFGGGSAPSPRYEIHVATQAPGGDWQIETVPLEEVPAPENQGFVAARFGLDAALDHSGELVLAFAAGGPGLATCGSSDLVIGRRSRTGAWRFEVPVTDSDACCEVCEAPSCCADPACVQGSDVGAWATLVTGEGDDLAVAYADYHFFWDQDGQTHQGLELFEGDGVDGVRPWSGLGAHSAMVRVEEALVIATTGFQGGGMHVFRRGPDPNPSPTPTPTGTSMPDAGMPPPSFDETAWTGVDLRPGWEIGERIALGVAPDGHVALVHHVRADDTGTLLNDLIYCRSTDQGFSFELPCQNIDARLAHLGSNPSLAFDPAGRPVVAYYVCGASDDCRAAEDGLRLAVRDAFEQWWPIDVHFDARTRSGLHSAIVIDPDTGAPIIAFQDLTRGAAMIARGRFQP